MDKDTILNNAKNNLQLFEKAQSELINARTGLINTKADLDKAIQELIVARDSIDEVLKNNPNDEIETLSEPVSEPVLEKVESVPDENKVEEETPSKKTSKSSPPKKKKEEPELELNEEDELDLGFLDEDSSDNDDIDKIEF